EAHVAHADATGAGEAGGRAVGHRRARLAAATAVHHVVDQIDLAPVGAARVAIGEADRADARARGVLARRRGVERGRARLAAAVAVGDVDARIDAHHVAGDDR